MIKKGLLAFVLVFSIVTLADATVIDVVTDGVGSMGHAGTIDDPLELWETVYIDIVLNRNPYPGYPSYDGYLLSSMDVGLEVSGAGSLTRRYICKCDAVSLAWHPGFDTYSYPADGHDPDGLRLSDLEDNYEQFAGISLGAIPASAVLLRGLAVDCLGTGNITVDLTLTGLSEYSPYKTASGNPYPGGWSAMVGEDMGNLTIYVVPEPTTIALLGLGGLLLRRKP